MKSQFPKKKGLQLVFLKNYLKIQNQKLQQNSDSDIDQIEFLKRQLQEKEAMIIEQRMLIEIKDSQISEKNQTINTLHNNNQEKEAMTIEQRMLIEIKDSQISEKNQTINTLHNNLAEKKIKNKDLKKSSHDKEIQIAVLNTQIANYKDQLEEKTKLADKLLEKVLAN